MESIIHSSYAVLFTIDAALLLLAAFGVGLMVYAQNRIKILRRAEKDALRARVIPKENSRTTESQLKKGQKHKSSVEINVQEKAVEISESVFSIDAMYADKNGLTVCKYCETINSRQSKTCCACGNIIND